MSTNYSVEAFTSIEALVQDKAWWELYHISFPEVEIEPKAALLNCLRQQAGLTLRVIDNEKQATIGMAHGQFLQSFQGFMLIYMAIASNYRNKQIGPALLNRVEELVNTHFGQSNHGGVVFEVDQPAYFSKEEEKKWAARRIAFYERLGYYKLDAQYYQPALSPEQSSVPMYLMAKIPTIPPQPLIKAIYFEKYAENYGISAINQKEVEATWEKVIRLNGW
jgi:GNAT superfamily N-acetyltransferase